MTNDVTNSNGRVTVDEVIHRDSVFRYQLLDRLRSDCVFNNINSDIMIDKS